MSRISRRGFLARTLYGIAVGSASACTVKHVVPRPGLPDYTETIGNTGVTFDMKGIPAGEGIPEFWLGRTEVTWDAFLLWAYEESQTPAGTRGADGVTHPTKPYGDVYRGYGRGTGNKQPALGMTHTCPGSTPRATMSAFMASPSVTTRSAWRMHQPSISRVKM